MEQGVFALKNPFEGATSLKYYIYAVLGKQEPNDGNSNTADCSIDATKTGGDVKRYHAIAPMYGRGLAGADPSRPAPTPNNGQSAFPPTASQHGFHGPPTSGFFDHSAKKGSSTGKGRNGMYYGHGRQGCNVTALKTVHGDDHREFPDGYASYRDGRPGRNATGWSAARTNIRQDSNVLNPNAPYRNCYQECNITDRMAACRHGQHEHDSTSWTTTRRNSRDNPEFHGRHASYRNGHQEYKGTDRKATLGNGSQEYNGTRPYLQRQNSRQGPNVANRNAAYRNGHQECKATDREATLGNGSQEYNGARPYLQRQNSRQDPNVANRNAAYRNGHHENHGTGWSASHRNSRQDSDFSDRHASDRNGYQQYNVTGCSAARQNSRQDSDFPDRMTTYRDSHQKNHFADGNAARGKGHHYGRQDKGSDYRAVIGKLYIY